MKELFEKLGIEYYTKGKNVTKGWVNIQCPYCSDTSNHLGINPERTVFNCWRCNESGSVVRLIKDIAECSHKEAVRLARGIIPDGFTPSVTGAKVIKPELVENLTKTSSRFLKARGFDPDYIKGVYGVRSTSVLSKDYKHRLYIPVYQEGKLVTFTTRALHENQEPKYKAAKPERCIEIIKDCLYNADKIFSKRIVLVEGVTDAWRLGSNAIAIFGKNLTTVQISKLLKLDIEHISIMLDSDAIREARIIASTLSLIFNSVDVIEIDEGDPADFDQDYARQVMRELT